MAGMDKRKPREIADRLSKKPLCERYSEVLKLREIVQEFETKTVEASPIFKKQS
jgi:hypothetical protein